jgi:DNA ligase D-like protein (predicted 3'-phosphoesterase)
MTAKEYLRKRHFSRTPEPRGNWYKTGRRSARDPLFVIQKHDASTLHYDFRIEVDGVLKSWTVPKGPSMDPRKKRLAIPTEDHPLEYAEFEGVIPQGQYGAGTVLIWDRGTYENMTKKYNRIVPIAKALERGHAVIRLHGKKMSGGFALHRVGRGKDERWLLIKMKDDHADARRNLASTAPRSKLSGRTLKEVMRQANLEKAEA